jgi:ABC-type amino acid transport substrate-binding protein
MRYGKLMVIRSTDRGRFASLSDLDLPGIRIAYNQGGLNDRFANTMFKQATSVGYASNELATADLLANKVDAQVSDSTAAIYLERQNPKLHEMAKYQVFNIWLDQIELDGTLAKVRAKWLGDASEPPTSGR